MTATRPLTLTQQYSHHSRPDRVHDRVLGAGLVIAALATALGSYWMITGPAAAEPRSHQPDRHVGTSR